MVTTKMYLDTRRAKKDGSYPIKIMVNRSGNFLVHTGMFAKSEDWAGTEFSAKALNARPRNIRLRRMLNSIENLLLDLDEAGRLNNITNSELKVKIGACLNGNSKELTFIECFDKFASTKTNAHTQKMYRLAKKYFNEFSTDLPLESINSEWLLRFRLFLQNTGRSPNTIATVFARLQAVFNFAITNKYTTNYPFRGVRVRWEPTIKKAIQPEQLVAIRDFPCGGTIAKYRDLFILSFYLIGINPIDLYNLKELTDGRANYKRAKTGRWYSVKVEPEAKRIIDRYRGKKQLVDTGTSNADNFKDKSNIALRKIGAPEFTAGEKKIVPIVPGITNYHARHTWATIAYNIGIPIETISAALGHSYGSPITAVYIRQDLTKIDEANRKVIDYLNGIQSPA